MLILVIVESLYFYTFDYCKYFVCYFGKLEIFQCGRVTLTLLSGANNLEAQVLRIINESVIDEYLMHFSFLYQSTGREVRNMSLACAVCQRSPVCYDME